MDRIVVEVRQEPPSLTEVGEYKVGDPVNWDFRDPDSAVGILEEIFTKCLDLVHLGELSARLQTKGRHGGEFVPFGMKLTIVSVKGAGKDEVGIRRLADQLGNQLTVYMVRELIQCLQNHRVSRHREMMKPFRLI